MIGPKTAVAQYIHQMKYRLEGESFEECCARVANALKDSPDHFRNLVEIFYDQRFLPGGRIQSAMGSPRGTTAYNCFVSGVVEDSMSVIMDRAKEAAETMRRGGGIGYDFSRLRPRGDRILSLDAQASGPVSYMGIFDAVCQTIASAGHRRGAQMAVLRIDHPDVGIFLRAKQNSDKLTGFNISLGVTDDFMKAVLGGEKRFPLKFEGRIYKYIDPRALWDQVMRSTWDWAEPGVLFLDTINRENNLHYCETLEASNPCAEQPLPPYGACLLGSFNLVKYVKDGIFDYSQFMVDIPPVVRAMDNVIDRTHYPLSNQEGEALNKRRMGLGVTGLANAAEMLGKPYGSEEFRLFEIEVLSTLRDDAYGASVDLAMEKGAFPLLCTDKYLESWHAKKLPGWLQDCIREHGIRNSHLTSIAPTGTISLTADNVSSGIEPPYSLETNRIIQTFNGPETHTVKDYAWNLGVKGLTADEISAQDHLNVLLTAQKFVDSAISKTCNVGPNVSFDDFSKLYTDAWLGGAKGLTTFRANGKRFGIFSPVEKEPEVKACYIDPETGDRTCDS